MSTLPNLHRPADPPVCGGVPVAMFAYFFPPDNYTGAARPHRFAQYLPQFGCPVRVIAAGAAPRVESGYVHRVTGEMDECRHRDLAGFAERVARKFFMPHDEGFTWTPRAVGRAMELHRESPFGAIFSTSPPYTTHYAAMWLKRKLGVRWIADFRDPLAGNPFRRSPADARWDACLERRIFRHADIVVANTEAVAAMWRKTYPEWAGKVRTIWNGFDPADGIGPMPAPPRPHKVIAHAGSIYGDRHPGLLFAAFRRLIERNLLNPREWRIRSMGFVDENSSMDRETAGFLQERGCLEWLPSGSKSQALAEVATADFLLLLDAPTGLQVPAKTFDYIRIGRPILATTPPHSETAAILRRCGIPHMMIHDGADPDAELLEFLRLPNEPVSPSGWFIENFSAEAQTRTLAGLLAG